MQKINTLLDTVKHAVKNDVRSFMCNFDTPTSSFTITISSVPKEKKCIMYMNVASGSVGDYDDWYYEDMDGREVNAVDLGEVVKVHWNKMEGNWEEEK